MMAEKKSLKGFISYLLGERNIDSKKLPEKSWRWKPIEKTGEKKPNEGER